jgi:hypothetical protein
VPAYHSGSGSSRNVGSLLGKIRLFVSAPYRDIARIPQPYRYPAVRMPADVPPDEPPARALSRGARHPIVDTRLPPSLSWIFRDRGAAAMSSRADFRLRFGSPFERGRQSRRNRMRQLKPFRLGSQAKSCSLSPVTQAGGALSGTKTAILPGGSFLPIRFSRPNL